MKRGRKGIKILGVTLLAALGLMAISVSAAQASGQFLINKTVLTGTDTETVAGTAGEGELLVEPLGLKINCTSGSVTGVIEAEDKAKATVLYNGCKVLENKFCKLYENESDMLNHVNDGHLIATGTGLLGLHNGKHYLTITGLGVNQSFATVFTNLDTEGCTLPLETLVTGSTAFLLPTALEELKNQTLETVTLTEEELLLGGKKLFYGKEAAHLTGGKVSDLHLTGKRENQPWGAL